MSNISSIYINNVCLRKCGFQNAKPYHAVENDGLIMLIINFLTYIRKQSNNLTFLFGFLMVLLFLCYQGTPGKETKLTMNAQSSKEDKLTYHNT